MATVRYGILGIGGRMAATPPAEEHCMFTDEHDAFRASLRAHLSREVAPHVDAWEAEGAFPAHEVFAGLAGLGALGLEYAPEDGGQGADHLFTVVLGEELGRLPCGGVPMAVNVQTDMATPSLARHGSRDLKDRYLRPALAGAQVAAIAVTEPDAGSDVAGLRTRARRDGDDWVITGTKLYITNGVQADWLCLLARTSDDSAGASGMSQIVVPTSADGVSVSRKLDKLGMRSSDTAELALEEVRVPIDHTIGGEGRGFQQQMQQFQNERLIAAYTSLGQLDVALERTVEYVNQRPLFGSTVGAQQHVAYTLAELSARRDALRSHCYLAAQQVQAGQDATRAATVAKLLAGRLLRETADACLQFHGGIGYMEETWTARFFRDTRLISIGGGADEVMLRVLAKLDGIG
jgi:citronellyl-CoA dehydrogenase